MSSYVRRLFFGDGCITTLAKPSPEAPKKAETYQGTFDPETMQILWAKEIKSGAGKPRPNPMSGTLVFLDVGGIWQETLAHAKIPRDFFSDMWSIVETPPGDLPTLRNDRVWLVLPPTVEQRGEAFVVTRRWKLSGAMNEARLEATREIYRPG